MVLVVLVVLVVVLLLLVPAAAVALPKERLAALAVETSIVSTSVG